MRKISCLFLFLFLFAFSQAHATDLKPYTLSVCAIFKDEAPYLKEWIEYHKIVGVEHFYLYNNHSTDNFREVLKPYIQANEVTVVDWANKDITGYEDKVWAWVFTTQVSAYEHAFEAAKKTSKWIAAIDIDEFLVPIKADTVVQVLDKYEKNFPGIQILWRTFGTGDVMDIPQDRLLIETLNKKAFANAQINRSYKTILKPDQYKNFCWPPHQCNYLEGKYAYPAEPSEIVINHYINRTKRYFYSSKVKKKEAMDNVKYSEDQITEMLKMGNDLVDTDRFIHRFVPALRAKMQTPNN